MRSAEPSPVGRDPWRFDDPPRRLVPTANGPGVAVPAVATTPPPLAAAIPAVLPSPEPALRYLGTFGPPEKKIAVFTDGSQPVNRLEGDLIDPRFRVIRIAYDFVEVERVDDPAAPALRLRVARR